MKKYLPADWLISHFLIEQIERLRRAKNMVLVSISVVSFESIVIVEKRRSYFFEIAHVFLRLCR